MFKPFLKKTILLAVALALSLAGLPMFGASAAGLADPNPPPATAGERLERAWARQQMVYQRLGRTDQFIERVQKLIERASANGKDVSEVQAALDAFAAAAKDAKPIYESMNGIVNGHQGFDDSGKVIDPEKAKETVQSMRAKLQELKSVMDGSGQALRDAIRAFREANPRPEKTPRP